MGTSSEPRTQLWVPPRDTGRSVDFQARGGGTEAPTDEHRGHGGLRLLFSHVNEQSPGEDRDVAGPQGSPLHWARDAGVAEDGGVAWPVAGAFLPVWGTEL